MNRRLDHTNVTCGMCDHTNVTCGMCDSAVLLGSIIRPPLECLRHSCRHILLVRPVDSTLKYVIVGRLRKGLTDDKITFGQVLQKLLHSAVSVMCPA